MGKKIAKNGQSITKLVHDVVASNAAYEHAIVMGYANLSALSRIIQQRLRSAGQHASVEAIHSALKRYRSMKRVEEVGAYRVLSRSSVTVMTDVIKAVFRSEKAEEILEKGMLISKKLIHISKTSNALTLVVNGMSKQEVLSTFSKYRNEVLELKDGLTLIIIHSPEEILRTPGCVEMIYRAISSAGINIEDTSSTYTDTLIVVKDADASKAFEEINLLINFSKNRVRES
ncbi:MAG: hypothetical protein ACP5LW_02280 [Nitrososphaeria archaeon]